MGAIDGQGFGDPQRMPKKSKNAGVELDPSALTTRSRDIAKLDALVQQKAGSVAQGFDPKPALPPHRRAK
jgi:hypothetical protein